MAKPMRKNGFVEGAVIAYAAIIVTKLLGALYNIPFYAIIGEEGGIVYSFAYNVYNLFLEISTSGIPVAISIVVSEYSTRGMYLSKEKAYTLGMRVVVSISLAAFVLLQVFAEQIALYYIADMTEGVSVSDVAAAVRAVSLCLLVVPFLSMRRGYLQGHKFMAASSVSQVIEQLVRIGVVLAGAYVAVNLLQLGTTVGVCISLFGAAVGALTALLYLMHKQRQSRELFVQDTVTEEKPESSSRILKRIFAYCITIVIVSVASSIYSLVDMKLILVGLQELHWPDMATQAISGISSTWVPKICMIIVALSMGLTNSIAPHIAESYAKGDLKDVNFKLNQALGTILTVSLPIALGMMSVSEPVYRLFYGESLYGGSILAWALMVCVFGSMVTVVGMAMQSMGRGKQVCLFTVIGIALNAGLDLPLIYLFDAIGLPAYLGATAASILGQAVTLLMLLGSLKRKFEFSYRPLFRILLKIALPIVAMLAAVQGLVWLWPIADGRGLYFLLQLGTVALCGAVVYGVSAFFCGALNEIMGQNTMQRILEKLHLRKK